jgi:ribose transport system substrate-binding protein
VNIDVNDWSAKIPTTVQTTIVRNSDLNFILPIYDGMIQFVTPAITQANAGDQVKVASYNGSPYALDQIRTGNIVTMDVGEPMEWAAMATLDQAFRVMLGEPPASSEVLPLRVWTKDNVAEAGEPAGYLSGWGTDFKTGYETLWGIAK